MARDACPLGGRFSPAARAPLLAVAKLHQVAELLDLAPKSGAAPWRGGFVHLPFLSL